MATGEGSYANWMKSLERAIANSARQSVGGSKLLSDPPSMDVGISECEVVLRKDRMRLLHYIGGPEKKTSVPLLLVYALINRPYILDLQPDRSVVQSLLNQGLDVYMIDWGKPRLGDRFLGLEDYVMRYLDDAVELISERSGQPKISLLGYCIGGYLAAVYASIHPERIKNLAVMAAPLDFGIDKGMLHLWTRQEYFDPEKVAEAFGNAPAQFLNAGFVLLDPLGNTLLKYMNLIENLDNRRFVEMFLRMERWLSDGIPVTGAFYVDLIRDGYQRNLFVKNQLKLNGCKAELKNLRMPLLAIVADKDHIVPPESTLGLLDVAPAKDKTTLSFPTGHIGLSVGGDSHKRLWPIVAGWFIERSK